MRNETGMRILSIGNSFSQDAQFYLHDLAAAEGYDMDCINLYIGGCSLKRHWENIQSDSAAYTMEHNGQAVNETSPVSARKIVLQGPWDIITLQQVSHESGQFETYLPYLQLLAQWVRQMAPEAQVMIQKTWAYETDSGHSEFVRYDRSQSGMYKALTDAYECASRMISAPLIPTGEVIQTLRALPAFDYPHGGRSLCRDGFHLNLGLGRYAASATWYTFMTKNPITGHFVPSCLDDEERKLLPVILEEIQRITLKDA